MFAEFVGRGKFLIDNKPSGVETMNVQIEFDSFELRSSFDRLVESCS